MREWKAHFEDLRVAARDIDLVAPRSANHATSAWTFAADDAAVWPPAALERTPRDKNALNSRSAEGDFVHRLM